MRWPSVNTMQLETKFFRLRTPVELGSRLGERHVTGWSRCRLYYLVVKLQPLSAYPRRVTARQPSPAVSNEGVRVYAASGRSA